jgi:GR25 family glycosyltransferase involved in LPS biosynthesis
MQHIGISYNPNKPVFYSGLNQTALVLAELFSQYKVTLVDYTDGEKTWWDDYPQTITVSKLHQIRDLDLLIDIDGIISDVQRQRVAKKSVVFLRTFLQFAEMDAQLYIETPYTPRSMNGVSEIWCWDVLNPADTIPSIQTMFPCPIKCVPFTWSSSVMEHFSKKPTHNPDKPWTVHVAEKNSDNTSSSVLPLTIIRELENQYPSNRIYKIHNMDRLKDNKFLKENVLLNIEFDKLNASFEDKQPFYEWTENDILLSHTRFMPFRTSLLNAVWTGIPMVHNSPFLRDLHPTLKKMYYEGNSITEAVAVFHAFLENPMIEPIREVLEQFSVKATKSKWQDVLHNLSSAVVVQPMEDTTSPLTIAFDDMWPGFNYDSNFIMDALRNEQPNRTIKGVLYSEAVKANLLIFGPYSTNWKKVTIPKVYFSGENWEHPTDPSISLFLSSKAQEDATHMRIPTWMHFIDWFSKSTTLPTNDTDNPIRMPLHFATTPHPISFDQRKKFCAFVVSNPICAIRNEAFQHLNTYKPVSSGGAYMNNIGGQLSLKYPGGGCGDISKHHFFAEHQFTISFENSQSPGYLTEKLLHAKMAGCLPLYWGDADAEFNPQSFVNLSNIPSADRIIAIVKHLETNPVMCAKIAATPPLDETRTFAALATISAMSRKLLSLASQHTQPMQPIKESSPIDKTYLINLDSRSDRLTSFIAAHPDLTFTRLPAINGKTLAMSDTLYNLCKKNTFQWKKSVIACALSHISVWNKIAQDSATYTLILEDDVRMKPGWEEHVRNIPEDAELLYLGGVLPSNRPFLPNALEKVNSHWSQIKPNTYFTKEPTPQFHFCAYSYILTKAAAQKLLHYLQFSEDKLCIPYDHLVGAVGLKKYIANDLLSGCFQEEDAQYSDSQFNDLHSEKKFDSDIYNNTECFDVLTYQQVKMEVKTVTLYYMGDKPDLYESTWLEDMFQRPIEYAPASSLVANGWCLVQRPYVDQWNALFALLKAPFHVLHLSDEFSRDSIDFYTNPLCKKVIRNYLRPNLSSNVHVIPLGYHHKATTVKRHEDRTLVWSFHGTDWFNRAEQLKAYASYVPYNCNLQPQWNDPNATKKTDYLALLGNSKFCPILKGNNMETYRMYEALEAGTLPVAVESNEYTEWMNSKLKLHELYNWTSPTSLGQPMTEAIQQEVMKRWSAWKEEVKEICRM